MKKIILLIASVLGLTAITKGQATIYNGPDYLLPNSTENYSSIKYPVGVTSHTWSISGTGGVITGSTTNALVFFDVTFFPVVLTVTFSNLTTFTVSIPVVQTGANLVEGNITMVAGSRQHQINQLLRGQRVKVKPINFTGVNPTLTLLSSQGRVIAQGDSIDFRSPTRGLFYVVVNSTSAGQLKVEGVSPYIVPGGINTSSTLPIQTCGIGNLDFQIDSKTNYTGGESMLTLGNKIITSVYDFVLNKTVINAYQNDVLIWTWLSNTNEYIRTLAVDATYGIAGIGSCGGALKNEDSVYVVKLNTNGVFQTRTAFGATDGRDYGFGISFLNDGTLLATGFTEGSFPTFTNTGTAVTYDAFAVQISSTGAVLKTLQFGSAANDRIFASKTLVNGNVLLFGDTEGQIGDTGSPLGSYDIFITELSAVTSTLTRIKNTQYGSVENDLAFDLVIEPGSKDIFITGQTSGAIVSGFGNPQRPQVYTARIDGVTHSLVWLKQLGTDAGQSGESIALSSTGVGTIFYTFGNFSGAPNNSLDTPASDDMVVALFDFNGNLDTLYQFNQTLERIFARAITFEGSNIFILRDHVYEIGKPYITTSLERFSNPLITTSINEKINLSTNILVYPNPFINKISIKNLIGNETCVLINLIGQKVYEGKTILEQDFSSLNEGVYFLKIISENSTKYQTLKLIKQ